MRLLLAVVPLVERDSADGQCGATHRSQRYGQAPRRGHPLQPSPAAGEHAGGGAGPELGHRGQWDARGLPVLPDEPCREAVLEMPSYEVVCRQRGCHKYS